eukprot:Gb_36373 [translate_table: standard]
MAFKGFTGDTGPLFPPKMSISFGPQNNPTAPSSSSSSAAAAETSISPPPPTTTNNNNNAGLSRSVSLPTTTKKNNSHCNDPRSSPFPGAKAQVSCKNPTSPRNSNINNNNNNNNKRKNGDAGTRLSRTASLPINYKRSVSPHAPAARSAFPFCAKTVYKRSVSPPNSNINNNNNNDRSLSRTSSLPGKSISSQKPNNPNQTNNPPSPRSVSPLGVRSRSPSPLGRSNSLPCAQSRAASPTNNPFNNFSTNPTFVSTPNNPSASTRNLPPSSPRRQKTQMRNAARTRPSLSVNVDCSRSPSISPRYGDDDGALPTPSRQHPKHLTRHQDDDDGVHGDGSAEMFVDMETQRYSTSVLVSPIFYPAL